MVFTLTAVSLLDSLQLFVHNLRRNLQFLFRYTWKPSNINFSQVCARARTYMSLTADIKQSWGAGHASACIQATMRLQCSFSGHEVLAPGREDAQSLCVILCHSIYIQ